MPVLSSTPGRILLLGVLTLLLMVAGLRLNLDSGLVKHSSSIYHQTRSLLEYRSNTEVEKNSLIPSSSRKGFVMSFLYPGQQGAGIRALGSFQCFLGSMTPNLAIAEPYFEDTKLRGVQLASDTLKMSSLFDFDHFNAVSKHVHYPELVNMDTFILHRPKPVILVKINHQKQNKVVWTSPDSRRDADKEVECLSDIEVLGFSSLEQKAVARMISSMRRLASERVCVVRIVNLDTSTTTFIRSSLQDLIFGKWQPEDVTLIFDKWSGPYSVPVPDPAHGMDCKKVFITKGNELQFKPSQRLLQDARQYRKAYLRGNRTVAVMFRMEKITNGVAKTEKPAKQKQLKYSIHKIEKCIAEVKQLEQTLEEKNESLPLVTMDVGKFGSSSLRGDSSKILSMANYTIAALYRNKWTLSEWEDSYTSILGNEKNKAYVAALQRMLASTADCLVLVGGGNFQALVLQDFMRNHIDTDFLSSQGAREGHDHGASRSKLCVHVLCAMRKKKNTNQPHPPTSSLLECQQRLGRKAEKEGGGGRRNKQTFLSPTSLCGL